MAARFDVDEWAAPSANDPLADLAPAIAVVRNALTAAPASSASGRCRSPW